MKFCRNLQRVIDITDSEWAPYWTNYKLLKKLLKNVVVPAPPPHHFGDSPRGVNKEEQEDEVHRNANDSSSLSTFSHHSGSDGTAEDEDGEERVDDDDITDVNKEGTIVTAATPTAVVVVSSSRNTLTVVSANNKTSNAAAPPSSSAVVKETMSRHPGEVAFFKLLNSELRKAIRFFEQAQLELEIREARVIEGITLTKAQSTTHNIVMVDDIWSIMARSLYCLYKDLLLLETYAIMSYCSFSKILKKHDKLTAHSTRIPFMTNVVNKANFAHYPRLLNMIVTCENLYDEVCKFLVADGKIDSVKSMEYTDGERGYITMIHQLHEQVLESAEGEGLCLVQQQQHQHPEQTTTTTTTYSFTEEPQQADRAPTDDVTTTATTPEIKLEVTRKRVHYFCSPPNKAAINRSDNSNSNECHDDDAITTKDEEETSISPKKQQRRITTATTDNNVSSTADVAATTRRMSTREKKSITRNYL